MKPLIGGLIDGLKILSLVLLPARNRSRQVYELLGTDNNLGETTRFLNLGYWKQARDYDTACRDLALLVAEAAELGPDDTLLDAGCGFGEQDRVWIEKYRPRAITAINVTPLQLDYARLHHGHARIDYVLASATRLPYPDASFTKVIALESAFHFETREAFFREAWRVLAPGGRLVLADVLPRRTPTGPLQQALAWLAGGMWQMPVANFYDPETCRQKLAGVGFREVDMTDLSADVWQPFKRFAGERVQDADIRRRVHPMLRRSWARDHGTGRFFAYVLLAGNKPGESPD